MYANLPHSFKRLPSNPVCECLVIWNVFPICGRFGDFQYFLENFFKSIQLLSLWRAPDLEASCSWKQFLLVLSCSLLSPCSTASNQAVLAYLLHLLGSVGNCQVLLFCLCEWPSLTSFCLSQFFLDRGCQGDLSNYKYDPFMKTHHLKQTPVPYQSIGSINTLALAQLASPNFG